MSTVSYAASLGLRMWPMGKTDEARAVAAWLNDRFLDWAKQTGERKTIREFSEYLEISEGFLSKWMRGERAPRNEHVVMLGNKLGNEVYGLLGWPTPISTPDRGRKTSRQSQ